MTQTTLLWHELNDSPYGICWCRENVTANEPETLHSSFALWHHIESLCSMGYTADAEWILNLKWTDTKFTRAGAVLVCYAQLKNALYFLGLSAAVLTFVFIGTAFVQITFGMLYVVTAECFPTTFRATALGMGSGLARVAGAVAPFIVQTVSDYLS